MSKFHPPRIIGLSTSLALVLGLMLSTYVGCTPKKIKKEDKLEFESDPETPTDVVDDETILPDSDPEEDYRPEDTEPLDDTVTPTTSILERANEALNTAKIKFYPQFEDDAYVIYSNKKNLKSSGEFLVFAEASGSSLSIIQSGENAAPLTAFSSECKVAVNGGYHTVDGSASIVQTDGQLYSSDAQNLARKDGIANPTRAAMVIDDTGKVRTTWATATEGQLFEFENPRDPFAENLEIGTELFVRDALGAGPMLVKEGLSVYSIKQEAFAEVIQPNSKQPRTSMGLLDNNLIVFYIADGRQLFTWGRSISELTKFYTKLGVNQAMNLDGGGSTTLVRNGEVLNKPSDGTERSIYSAICIR